MQFGSKTRLHFFFFFFNKIKTIKESILSGKVINWCRMFIYMVECFFFVVVCLFVFFVVVVLFFFCRFVLFLFCLFVCFFVVDFCFFVFFCCCCFFVCCCCCCCCFGFFTFSMFPDWTYRGHLKKKTFKLAKQDCSVLFCASRATLSTIIKIMRSFGCHLQKFSKSIWYFRVH